MSRKTDTLCGGTLMNTEQSVDTPPNTNRRRQPCRSVNMGPPVCVCNNEEEQWAQAVGLIHETSSHFVEVQDRKAAWDLLAKCFPIQFFDLLNIPAPYTLQGRQGKETNKARLIQNLPEEAQRELKECEETLKAHADIVEAHKGAARIASKRKALIFSEAELTAKETKLEKERQALNLKRRRTEAEACAVQNNHVSTNPDKGKQLKAPAGISPLLKQVSERLASATGVNVVPVEDFSVNPNVPKRRTRVSRIVPPAQSVIEGLWVPDRGTIRPQLPQGEIDVTKPPFTIDGRILHPVVERIDRAVISQLIDHGLLVPRREVNLEGPQANTSEQAEPSQAEAIGELVRPTSSTGPVTEPASDTDPDDIIIELLKLTTPKKVKIKKEPKPKKTVKASKVKSRVTSTRRTKKTPKTPSLVASEDDLFGSVSEDETTLLASPKAGPSTVPTPEPTSAEPIEVDPVDLEIHPTQADLLGQDAERINFDQI
ncbi:hypothetical protein DAPPUDRAFT_256358 [Daphnia pulex]|uniref:Uncharacterized protein n=1 Tax=Daphnia pulex TaxID=6669 RepID=E9HB55_DAPPU|nr:hypothetical protein DAPPUDRAFT_256358 [Daphnia pulex]|eukprot:EFX71027.1 hypothetical protein DAPPUDRAFT_256358 [Daphnia pulex]